MFWIVPIFLDCVQPIKIAPVCKQKIMLLGEKEEKREDSGGGLRERGVTIAQPS